MTERLATEAIDVMDTHALYKELDQARNDLDTAQSILKRHIKQGAGSILFPIHAAQDAHIDKTEILSAQVRALRRRIASLEVALGIKPKPSTTTPA